MIRSFKAHGVFRQQGYKMILERIGIPDRIAPVFLRSFGP
jgi:hypothetical protein